MDTMDKAGRHDTSHGESTGSASVDARAEALVAGYLEAVEEHLENERHALLEAHPDKAGAIRDAIEARRVGGGAGVSGSDGASDRIGRYQPLEELGRGGQGLVYLAEDTHLGRVVALKVLRGFGPLSEQLMERFKREAEVTSKLDHPGICRVYDAGVTGGVPYIAMQFIRGTTLADTIRNAKSSATPEPSIASYIDFDDEALLESLDSDEAAPASTGKTTRADVMTVIRIIERAARALHVAHEAGIIHRDIKPGNIMITPAGEPVLLDFGLAGEEADELALTQTGDIFGTPAYMSPEQLEAHRIRPDRRTDVFSLAVTLYECVTLRRPFEAPTRHGLYRAIQNDHPPDVRRINRAIPADLAVVLEKALEKDRDQRYATALEFADDLKRVGDTLPIAARPVSRAGRLVRWAKRRPALAALVVVLLVGAPTLASLIAYAIAKQPEIAEAEHKRLRDEIEGYLEAGFAEIGHGDRRVAIERFDDVLALDASSPEAIGGKALALIGANEHEAALAILGSADTGTDASGALDGIRATALRALDRADEIPPADDTRRARSALAVFLGSLPLMNHCERQSSRDVFRRAAEGFSNAAMMAPRARLLYHAQLLHALGHLLEVDRKRGTTDPELTEQIRNEVSAMLTLWPDSARAHIVAGRALRSIDAERAAGLLERAIALDATDDEPRVYLGGIYVTQGRLDEAIAVVEQAIAIRGTPIAYANLADAYEKRDGVDAAIRTLREGLDACPKNGRIQGRLAQLFEKQGEEARALAAVEQACRWAPDDARLRHNYAHALAESGEHRRAVEEYRVALALDPHLAMSSFGLGNALVALGRDDDAIAAFERAIELDPGHAAAHANLGPRLLALGRNDETIALAKRAIELDPSIPVAHGVLARALASTGELDAALAAALRATELHPKSGAAHFSLGFVRVAMADYDAGAAAYALACKFEPAEREYHHNHGYAHARAGRHDAAIAAYREALDCDGDFAKAHNSLALALQARGDREAAVESFERAIRLAPKAGYGANLGHLLAVMGRPDDAIEVLEKTIERNATLAIAHSYLGNALEAKGQLEDAIRAQQTAVSLDPTSAPAHNNLGNALRKSKRLDEALAAYRKAVELDSALGLAHLGAGLVLRDQRNLELAREALGRAVKLLPNRADVHFQYGLALVRTGRRAAAARHFAAAARLRPSFVDAHQNLAFASLELERNDDAIRAARAALERRPRFEHHYIIGTALVRKGRVADGVAALRAGLAMTPHPMGYNALGATLCDHARDYAGAIAAFEQAIERMPNNPFLHRNLARALRCDGRIDDAIAAYERAEAIATDAMTKQLLADTRALASIEARLARRGNDDSEPKTAAEAFRFAEAAALRDRHADAARFAIEAVSTVDFAASPDGLLLNEVYESAAIVLRAAESDGVDAATRTRWRRSAIGWLTQLLAAHTARFAESSGPRHVLASALRVWRNDPALRAVRGNGIARLPETDGAACERIWTDVDALLARIREEMR